MSIRIARRFALILAVLVTPWALSGCGDSTTTSIPTNVPTPPKTETGKYVPPPTAAQPAKTIPAR